MANTAYQPFDARQPERWNRPREEAESIAAALPPLLVAAERLASGVWLGVHGRRKAGYIPPAAFLNAYLGLGDTEEAFTWLGRAAEERSNITQFLKVHPFFDPLRGDPRFAAFLRRANFQ